MNLLTITATFLVLSVRSMHQGDASHQQSNVTKPGVLQFRPESTNPLVALNVDEGRHVNKVNMDETNRAVEREELAESMKDLCISGKSCGDTFCCCEGDTASCANLGLTYIPALPTTVRRLDFSNNSLGVVDNSTMANVTSLQVLDVTRNQITSVLPGGFARMTNLRQLHLGLNELSNFDSLVAALKDCHALRLLNISYNRFESLNLGRLPAFPALQQLIANENSIKTTALDNLDQSAEAVESRLEMLDLGSNLLLTFPNFCCQGCAEGSFLPYLHTLNLEWNIITAMQQDTCRCLPTLKNLNLEGNSVHHIQSNFLQGLPALENLSLRFCSSRRIDSYAFNHSNIRYLNVSENLWFFDSQYGSGISPGLFWHLPRLEAINMSWTVFRFSQYSERQIVLSSLSHVEEIVLQGVGLDFIPQAILNDFTHLRSFSFSKNELAFLPDDSFENLTSLRSLDLHDNHLTSVSQSLLENILQRKGARIDLSENPFSCTCDLLWFIEKYKADFQRKADQRVFVGSPYKCNGPDSTRDQRLDRVGITRNKCMLNYQLYVVILFVTTFTLVLLIVGAVIYKFRWQLRFMMYTLQHRLSRGQPSSPAPAPTYDVFVSYDSDDSGWVVNTLQPELENKRGLKLCLHERDFTPGKFISHNIIEKMEESGAILPVLSNAFLHSDWCRFELFLAFKNGLKRSSGAAQRIAVLPVLLEELQREGVDSLLYAVLSTTTYLAWPREGGQEEQDRFWSTLCQVLERNRRGRELGAFPPV